MKKTYIIPALTVYRLSTKNRYGMDTMSEEVAPDYAREDSWLNDEPASESGSAARTNIWEEW